MIHQKITGIKSLILLSAIRIALFWVVVRVQVRLETLMCEYWKTLISL